MQRLLLTILLFAILPLSGISVYGSGVAVIKSGDIEPYEQAFEGFKSVYNGHITEFVISKRLGSSKDLLDNIEAVSPDVILSIGIDALLFAKDNIRDIPNVYCMVMHPEKYEIVNNNNVTGITLRVSTRDLMLKCKSVMPRLKRLGLIYDPGNTRYLAKEAGEISKTLGIELVTEKIRSEKSVPKALRKLAGKIDALWLVADATVVTRDSFDFIILYTLENNIPLMTYSEAFVEAGALMSLSVDYFEIGKHAAKLVNDVLNKRDFPLNPIIEPEHSRLILNIKTANTIGIYISAEVIESSEEVIK